MSSISTSLDYLSTQYNFTNAISKAYGVNSMVQLSPGVFGMFAADANGNGQVQNNDRENFWVPQNGQSGYKQADFNLNGQVQNNDIETFWSQIMGREVRCQISYQLAWLKTKNFSISAPQLKYLPTFILVNIS
jgi:hypothetical protein